MWSEGPSGLMQGATVRMRPPKDFKKGEADERLESTESPAMPAPIPSPMPSAAPEERPPEVLLVAEPLAVWERVVVAVACANTTPAGEEAMTNNESSAPIQFI